MAAAMFMLLVVLFLSTGINGIRIRTPCTESSNFRCDSGYYLAKHHWCDNSNDCDDSSDEKYCHPKDSRNWFDIVGPDCDDNIHFRCENANMCIPRAGYCDGYSSCPDRSDEKGCPCEELDKEEGDIEYEAFIGGFRTHQKCWKITVGEGVTLDLTITAKFYSRDCTLGNVTVHAAKNDGEDEMQNNVHVLCASSSTLLQFPHDEESFVLHEDTLIRYRSNFYEQQNYVSTIDLIIISYRKVDDKCLEPGAFRCTPNSCISPEKQCDEIKDCHNGKDEQNCDYSIFSAAYLEANRKKSVEWLKNQHNADWGWKDNTHKAVVALRLAGGMSLNDSNNADDLIAKQLELEVYTFLFRSKADVRSSTELASFINALLVICHDPRNFYGYDLVAALKDDLETAVENAPPYLYLTLCNAREPISQETMNFLVKILKNSTDHGFLLEIKALAIMAISCAINNNNQYEHLKQEVNEALDNLKKEQMDDGSFGNEYTTALVLQALIANKQEKAKDWNPKSAIMFLTEKQEANGSFDNTLTTYLVLPVFSMKSLLDIGNTNCTADIKRPRDGGAASDIKNRLGGKIVVKYSLFIGDEKDQVHPIVLRMHESITVLELMTLAADIDPKYKFKTHQIKKKTYVYEISNIPNDPVSNKFWFIYQGVENGTIPMSEQSPNKVKVHKNDHIIMWYKTLDFI